MTNEELKKIIVEVYKNVPTETVRIENVADVQPVLIKRPIPELLADDLIAAGLRFGENLTATFDHIALEREHELEHRLAEAEHRAEVAERALFLSAKEIEYLNGNFDSSAEFFAKEKVIPYFMRQAEEELNKESKD